MATTAKTAGIARQGTKEGRKEGRDGGMRGEIRYPLWFGGSATSMAACVTHPFDLVKVRLQTLPPGPRHTLSKTTLFILRTEGPRGLYAGISASLLRQLTYSTVRFALYDDLKHRLSSPSPPSPTSPPSSPSLPVLVGIALLSGTIGGLAGNPADVVNVRMQNDTSHALHLRRNYKNAIDGLAQIARSEGLSGLMTGWAPNCMRAGVTTAGQLATYDEVKRVLVDWCGLQDGAGTQLAASVTAGVVTATVTNPVDVVKTRCMASPSSSTGIREVMKGLVRTEGLRWMIRGWIPSFVRQGPHTVCIFAFLEAHRGVYRRLTGED